MHQSFLSYRRKRYLWIALILCVASIVAYGMHEPRSSPNGGTWLGYTLGTIGAVLILWLTALGIRKRSYKSRLGTVQGWVSAHVYLGLALLVVVTLHTGFQVGWNIHTLAYVLMVLVILSGLVGISAYLHLPAEMSSNRQSLTREQMWAELADLDQRCLRVAARLPPEFRDAASSNRDRTRVGGSAWTVLAGVDRSQVLLPAGAGNAGIALRANPDQSRVLEWLAAEQARSNDGDRTRAVGELISLVSARRVLLKRLRRDAQIRGWLEVWLYVHVPASLGLIGALIAHVVSVFFYW
jgi:hypothetical protein